MQVAAWKVMLLSRRISYDHLGQPHGNLNYPNGMGVPILTFCLCAT